MGDHWNLVDVGRGPPLLLIHGYPLTHWLWQYQIEAFSQTFRVLAPDLPGFGSTPATGDDVLSMSRTADLLADLLPQWNVHEPVMLAGLSLGGYIALEFCSRHRNRVNKLVFCDSRIVADNEAQRSQRLQTADSVFKTGMEPIIEAMLPKLLSTQSIASPDVVDQVKSMMRDATPAGVSAIQRGMASRRDFTNLVTSFDFPVLCLVGEEDAISPPAEMQQIAALMPQARCEVIPHAGHLSPLEQPELFNKHLKRFLD